MIDNGKPLIIYGMPGIKITSAHSWNIDGYKVKERTISTEYYNMHGTLLSTENKIETLNMVHCDFGWKGDCNGYYVSGVFDLDDTHSEKDFTTNRNTNKYYNTLIRLITYDKP